MCAHRVSPVRRCDLARTCGAANVTIGYRRRRGATSWKARGFSRRVRVFSDLSVVVRTADSLFDGPGGELGTGGEVELREGARDVAFDGALADAQGAGDLPVGV